MLIIINEMNTRDRFNRFYSDEKPSFGDQPSLNLLNHVDLSAITGEVIDLGCGDGRDSLYLARNGLRVTAVDTSEVGLKKLMTFAEKNGIADLINTVCADVRYWTYPESKYELMIAVTIFDHLPREQVKPVFRRAAQSIIKGGIFLAKVHTIKDPGYTHTKQSSELSDMIKYYFKPGELLEMSKTFYDIIHYEENESEDDTHGQLHYHHFAEIAARKK